MVPAFRRYIALGDSISIDLYPALDLAARSGTEPPAGYGAASLFHTNMDALWPEFQGFDLASLYPSITLTNLTMDGASTQTVIEAQLSDLPEETEGPTLATLTAGGNDLLWVLGAGEAEIKAQVESALENIRRIISRLQERYADLTLLVGTVYDPSDGTGDLGDGLSLVREMEWLRTYNERLVEVGSSMGCAPIDIHQHFMGYGRAVSNALERWYWTENIIEPSARGASEVRRLRLRALGVEI